MTAVPSVKRITQKTGMAPRYALWVLSSALFFAGCVSMDQLPPGSIPGAASGTPTAASFPDLDPGATSISTLHFVVKGYTENEIRPIAQTAESLYDKIGRDTGLYSFLASGTYGLIIYKDKDEYLAKTHQPSWSRAVAVSSSVYTYGGADLEPYLAHELTHVIFNNYMGDRTNTFRWLNEGLAMFEEVSKMSESDRSAFQSSLLTNLRQQKMPFSQMSFFTPSTEDRRRTDAWYQQAESVTAFMLNQGSALAFAAMMGELRSGADLDRALNDNYAGKFRSMADLENAWKYTI